MKSQQSTLRNVAILVSSLDSELGDALLEQLTPDQVALVRQAMESLEPLAEEERASVVEEFRLRKTPQQASGGVEFCGRLADDLSWSAEDDAAAHDTLPFGLKPTETTPTHSQPFSFLENADADSLLPFLRKEGSQTIAVVLSYLPEYQAAQVIDQLPANQQVEIMERLADLDETDQESLRVVERELKLWVEQQRRRRQRQMAGLAAVRGILSHLSASSEQTIMRNLKRRESPIMSMLTDHVAPKTVALDVTNPITPSMPSGSPEVELTWDAMARLSSSDWADVLREAEPALVVLALAGGTDELFEHATRHLAKHDVDALAHERAHLGPTRLSDVAVAQDELASLAATFIRRRQTTVVSSA